MKRLIARALRLRSLLVTGLFLMLSFSGSFFLGGVTQAANWTGRAEFYGYFDNKYGHSDSPYPDARGPVIDNNDYASDSIPASVNTKQELIDYLKDKYNNPGTFGHPAWDKAGASFVVNTMIGRDPNASSRAVSGAMWTELSEKLLSARVTMSIQNVSAGSYGNVNTFFQYPNNDVAYYIDPTESGKAIVLSVGGKVVYVLLYKCANPLGNLDGLPEPPKWTLTAATTGSKTNTATTPPLAANEVIPGDTITWHGAIKNTGPDATDVDVATRFNKSNGWTGTQGARTIPVGFANGATSPSTYAYTPTDADLGKTLCVSTWAQPHAWNDTNPVESAPVCYNVVWRYELHPVATVNSGTSTNAESGTNGIAVDWNVKNDGPTTSKSTSWQLTQCIYPGNAPASTGEVTNGSTGAATYGAGASKCTVTASGTQLFTKNTVTPLGNTTADTGTYPAGTHICYVLSVNPPSATATGYRHSQLACIAIVKYPKIQALGGDVRAQTIATHTSVNQGGKYYGSWSEYGIFGVGGISGMVSGGSLANGAATSIASVQKSLTFANTPGLGGFYSVTPAPNATFAAYWAKRPGGSGGSQSAGGPVANGTKQVIYVDGTLTINSNIEYSHTYNNLAEVPQVIYVVNGNIIIGEGVTQVDAWLITNQTLFTCSSDAGATRKSLTVNDCTQTLTFNGPVDANQIRLSRTKGADGEIANRGVAAEIFNLAPNIFLSTYSTSISASNIQTVYEKELPPRW